MGGYRFGASACEAGGVHSHNGLGIRHLTDRQVTDGGAESDEPYWFHKVGMSLTPNAERAP
jgi:hypothetical protein